MKLILICFIFLFVFTACNATPQSSSTDITKSPSAPTEVSSKTNEEATLPNSFEILTEVNDYGQISLQLKDESLNKLFFKFFNEFNLSIVYSDEQNVIFNCLGDYFLININENKAIKIISEGYNFINLLDDKFAFTTQDTAKLVDRNGNEEILNIKPKYNIISVYKNDNGYGFITSDEDFKLYCEQGDKVQKLTDSFYPYTYQSNYNFIFSNENGYNIFDLRDNEIIAPNIPDYKTATSSGKDTTIPCFVIRYPHYENYYAITLVDNKIVNISDAFYELNGFSHTEKFGYEDDTYVPISYSSATLLTENNEYLFFLSFPQIIKMNKNTFEKELLFESISNATVTKQGEIYLTTADTKNNNLVIEQLLY